MEFKLKHSLLAVCIATGLLLSGCGSDNDNNNSGVITTPGGNDGGTGTQPDYRFVSERPYSLDSVDTAGSMKIMDYTMPNVRGETITTSAFVFFPKTAKPEGGYKVVVWQHGTLGVADECAPSANVLNPRFKDPLAKELLAAGYVVIAPDYEGLGSTGIHPYLDLKSQSISTVAAVKAAQTHYADQLSKEWMTVGQSQGGQASLGTAEYVTQNPDAGYKGAVAGAPASSLDVIIFNIAPLALADAEAKEKAAGLTIEQRQGGSIGALATLLTYSSFYAVGVKATDPQFDYKTVFAADRTRDLVQLAEGTNGENGLCLDTNDASKPEKSLVGRFTQDIAKFLTENPDKSINDYPTLDRQAFYGSTSLVKAIADSDPGKVKINTPVMIIQGTEDMSVPYPITDALYQKYKKMDVDVVFEPVLGATHTQAIVQANDKLLKFIQTYMPAKTVNTP
ncbi:alpha/beta hydrolase [Acinetobacter indicus]|uniref:alpha/beta hydrolase n=1 Tax=Acinetobacter TaxID=469 RepID=UPI0015D1FE4F|nr:MULTISPECIES: lipase family protein [Acinetobacter]MCP0917837.1 alpha/beta hydrolase [Acinetobacter indicus]